MSCDTNGLLIINSKNKLDCDSFCNFVYKYPIESITATNNGSYVSLKYNKTNSQSSEDYAITYNNPKNGEEHRYSVDEIRIYVPSLHSFDYSGNLTPGEIIISHIGNFSNKRLILCIPLTSNSGIQPMATNQLTTIISNMNKTANSENESTIVPNFNLDLNKFIPKS